MFILGFIIFLIISSLNAVLLGGSITDFLNIPSLLIILLPLVAVMTATRSFKVFAGGLKAVMQPLAPLPEELRGQAASLFRLLSKTTALAAGIGFLICMINMLMGIDFSYPEIRNELAGNIAANLVLPLYALILIAAIFEPVVFNLKKRRDTTRK